jgi:hypothetical protein
MTAPVVRMRVSTVAPRPRPASKGRGRPGTPLTVLEGAVDPRGTTTAGLAPGRTWLVVVDELLGGKLRRSLPAYASWLYATEDLEALAPEAAAWAAQGLVAFPDEPRAGRGHVTLSDKPGLGVDPDRSLLEPVSP